MWIDTNDRLPEPGVKVLARCIGLLGKSFTAVLWHGPNGWTDEWFDRATMLLHKDIRVTHWQPLPEPPEAQVVE